MSLKTKNCIAVMSYCETEEKLNTLKVTLSRLMQIEALKPEEERADILVHAHYPVPTEVQTMCNHYLFDASNPVFPLDLKFVIYWLKLREVTGEKYLVNKNFDVGFAACQQIKRICQFLHGLGEYRNVHILNYDVDNKDLERLYNENYDKLKEHDIVAREFAGEYGYCFLHLGINIDSFVAEVAPRITKKEYLSRDKTYAEPFLKRLIDESNLSVYTYEEQIESTMHSLNTYLHDKEDFVSKYGKYWMGLDRDNLAVLLVIYDCDTFIQEITVDYGFGTVTLQNKSTGPWFFAHFTPHLFPTKLKLTHINTLPETFELYDTIEQEFYSRYYAQFESA